MMIRMMLYLMSDGRGDLFHISGVRLTGSGLSRELSRGVCHPELTVTTVTNVSDQ